MSETNSGLAEHQKLLKNKVMDHSPKSRVRFIAGFIFASLFFGVSAIAVNVNNTPEGGYLLCYNKTTKAVTFPGKLKCPKGTSPLELGAEGQPGQDGIDGSDGLNGVTGATGPQGPQGPQGPTGPRGPSGANTVVWTSFQDIDIVAEGNITSGSQMVKKILISLDPKVLPLGYNKLVAHIGGNWADAASRGDVIDCFFQEDSEYQKVSGGNRWGATMDSYADWNYFNFSVAGDYWVSSTSTDKLHLICKTSGTVRGVDGRIDIFNYPGASQLGSTRLPPST